MFSGNLVPCGHWKNSCTGWVPLSSPICRGKKLRQTYSPPPPLSAHDDRGRRGEGGIFIEKSSLSIMTSSANDFYMKEGEILSNKYNSFTKGSETILMSPTPPPPPPTCRLLQGGESEINFPLSLLSLSTRTFACSRSRVGVFFAAKFPAYLCFPLFPSL